MFFVNRIITVSGLLSFPLLCGCSMLSLKLNWESVVGKGRADDEITASILKGDGACRFLVKLK
jgi:hypothetical protein